MQNFNEWGKVVPVEIKTDIVWKIEAYKMGLTLSDFCWQDSELILAKRRFNLADQLYRSVGSIRANIAEGYSLFSDKVKARFCEITLGSTSETKDWYFKNRHILGLNLADKRIKMLTSIAKLLQSMIIGHRSRNHKITISPNHHIIISPILISSA